MKWLDSIRAMVTAALRSSRTESELEEELREHIRNRANDLERDGLTRAEAERRARIEFGSGEKYKEECREAMGTRFFDNLLHDLQFTARTLRKAPGFTAVAVLTLALGIAVNTTMFSMVSAFLLRRPPGHDTDRVVVVSSVNPEESFLPDTNPVSAANYLAWRNVNHVFADVAASDESLAASLTEKGESEAVRSAAVTLNYFSVLGVSPQYGRTFASGEDQPGRDHVVILSHDLWERRFGSDPAVLGRTIRVNRENYDVVGIMPADFHLLGFTPQLWTPLVLTQADETPAARKDRSLYLFARLKTGVTVEQARAEMAAFARRAEEDFPQTEKGWGSAVRTLPDFLIYSFGIRVAILVMMTAVGFVLMIACANVAGLLLARASNRRKELAVRISLGASPSRIVLQLLTEGLVIAFFGGAVGLLLANWGIKVLRANLAFNDAVTAVPVSLDWNVALFALAVSVISAVLCGLAPALSAARTDVSSRLREEGRSASGSRSRSRMRSALVAVEVAMALFLLIGTGLLLRALFVIQHQNLGFRAENLLTAGVTLDPAQYKDASQRSLFVQNVIPHLLRIPGSNGAAVASNLPASGAERVTVHIQGQPEVPGNQPPSALNCVVTPDYFRTAGISLLRGREFSELDNATAPGVVVVNQEFVHRHLHDQDALGKQIRLDVSGAPADWSVIVGVASNVKTYSQETRDDPEVYEAFFQRPVPSFSLMLRTNSDPSGLAAGLRAAVAQTDPELPLARVMSMSNLVELQKGGTPLFERILATFGCLALILAAIGIYGLVAFSVGQRTHEIGVRIALGAGRLRVLRLVLGESLRLTLIGAAAGLVLTLPLPKLFNALFYGLRLQTMSLVLYLTVPLVIVLVSGFAAYLPARRAMKVDPMIALRYE